VDAELWQGLAEAEECDGLEPATRTIAEAAVVAASTAAFSLRCRARQPKQGFK
jgi:hypothetical protein